MRRSALRALYTLILSLNRKSKTMKKFLLALSGMLIVLGLQAQKNQVPSLEEINTVLAGKKLRVTAAAREIVSCTRQTDFNWNETAVAWDSTSRTITEVDETNGYTTFIQKGYQYDAAEGWVIQEETRIYGIDNLTDPEARFDSLVILAPDQVSGDLVVFVKGYNIYNAQDKLQQVDVYLNTGFFGIPLGTVLFGRNLFFYDANGFLTSEASKQLDFNSFTLVNGDSTSYANNSAGQPLTEASFEWDAAAGSYIPLTRYTYTYISPGGDVQTQTIEEWDDVLPGFAYTSNTNYTYVKAGLVSKEEIQVGNPGSWITVQEVTYTYDAQDRLLEQLQQTVDPAGAKEPFSRINNQYDTPEGWTSLSTTQSYIGGAWFNNSRSILEPCEPQSSVQDALAAGMLKAYFSSAQMLQLDFDAAVNPLMLSVIDMQGRLVTASPLHAGTNQVQVPAGAGIYNVVVRFANGTVVSTKVAKL